MKSIFLLTLTFLISTSLHAAPCKDWIKYKTDGDFQYLKRSKNFWWPNHQLIIRDLVAKEAPFIKYPSGNFFRAQTGFYLYPNQTVLFAPHSKAMNHPNGNPLKRDRNFFYANGRPARINDKLFTEDGHPTNRESIKLKTEFEGGTLMVVLKEKVESVVLEIPELNFTAVQNDDGFDVKILLPTGRAEELVILRLGAEGKLTCEVP